MYKRAFNYRGNRININFDGMEFIATIKMIGRKPFKIRGCDEWNIVNTIKQKIDNL